jgi:hypothetical protein
MLHVCICKYIPGSHSAITYSPLASGGVVSAFCFFSIWGVGMISSKPVPPPGRRTKRFVKGVVRCEPGRKDTAPFNAVHLSSAIQNPSAVGGEVYFVITGENEQVSRGTVARSIGDGKQLTKNVLRFIQAKTITSVIDNRVSMHKWNLRVVVLWDWRTIKPQRQNRSILF